MFTPSSVSVITLLRWHAGLCPNRGDHFASLFSAVSRASGQGVTEQEYLGENIQRFLFSLNRAATKQWGVEQLSRNTQLKIL